MLCQDLTFQFYERFFDTNFNIQLNLNCMQVAVRLQKPTKIHQHQLKKQNEKQGICQGVFITFIGYMYAYYTYYRNKGGFFF